MKIYIAFIFISLSTVFCTTNNQQDLPKNINVRTELESIYDSDQLYRKLYTSEFDSPNKNLFRLDYLSNVTHKLDLINTEKVDSI